MKLIPILILLTSCTVDCPDQCLDTEINNGSTTFELPEPQEPGLKYYVSIQSETQGIISQQIPASGSVTYPYDMNCQDYYLFVFDNQNSSLINQSIINFYTGVDTSMVYFCKGVVGCI